MAKWGNDNIADQGLSWIKTNFDKVSICKSQPTTYSQAVTSYKLGSAAHSITSSPGDWGSSGRQVTIPLKNSIAITSAGKMQHVALVDVGSTTLIGVTTIPTSSQASVKASDKVNMAAFNWRIADVTPS